MQLLAPTIPAARTEEREEEEEAGWAGRQVTRAKYGIEFLR